jgi:hypothetical protein
LLLARNAQFENTTTAAYDPVRDIDGNGAITYTDLIRVRNRLGASLPHAGPSPAAAEAIVARRSETAPATASTPLAAARRPLAAATVDRVLNHSTSAPTVASSASLRAARTHAIGSVSPDAALAEPDQSLSVVRRRR